VKIVYVLSISSANLVVLLILYSFGEPSIILVGIINHQGELEDIMLCNGVASKR